MPDQTEQLKKLIDQGRYFEARSRAEKELEHSQDLRLKQLYALALSKCGVPEAALTFMESVYSQFPDDPESAGILGSICKELFKKTQTNSFAIRSRDTYLKNFAITKNYYTGINAASMSAMAGQVGKSREIATEVIALLPNEAKEFWELTTLGEAYMLTKNRPKTLEYYVQARKEAGQDWGKITSVYNQLWLLNHFLPVPNEILKLFSPPKVATFVGHMIDHPNRNEPRFPAAIGQKVKDAILHTIRSSNLQIGYCSLACGGDILFAEAMAEEGREVNIFLPFNAEDFLAVSVQFAGTEWTQRFNALLSRFPVTYVSHESYQGMDDIFLYQTKIIFGAATLRSRSYHHEPTLVTVLSEVDLQRKEGGTRDTIGLWPFPKNMVNINPDIFLPGTFVRSVPAMHPAGAPKPSLTRPVLYLVYVNLMNLPATEREKLLHYQSEDNMNSEFFFLPEPSTNSLLAAFPSESASIEYLFFAMETLKASGHNTSCKINLHAGPVAVNPAPAPQPLLDGNTVSQIREMSVYSSAGEIFASDHFATLLALAGGMFEIEYAGIFLLPSNNEKTTLYKIGIKSRNRRS
jgi:tetratricopeptide (TPR) repeat protein